MPIKNLSFILFFIFFINNANAFVRGINYDPVHSIAFAHGVGADDAQIMQQAIFDDLDKLKQLGNERSFKITHIKTFFSQYNSLHNQVSINIADVVYQWNQMNPDSPLTLAIGVYEFRPQIDACVNETQCQEWTQNQINAVKTAWDNYNANQIPLIDRVIVGNEDLDTNNMESRLVNNINQIKKYIVQRKINASVGTAQTQPSVMDMYNGKKYSKLLSSADFIGVNFYPYWSGVPYGDKGITAKEAFAKDWQDLKKSKNWGKKPVIETEEGWPSYNNALTNEFDYFNYWYYGHTPNNSTPKPGEDYLVQTSYLFALNDKLPGQGVESHWGVLSADNKQPSLNI